VQLLVNEQYTNAQYLFFTYIYRISPTCFGVTFTIIRDNPCALYFRPYIVL